MSFAVIQMVSGADIGLNLQMATRLLRQAKEQGAQLVVLPENFATMGYADIQSIGEAELKGSGVILPWLTKLAKELGLWIQAGTIPLPPEDNPRGKVRSSALLIDAQGKQVARYDKLHMFDAQIADRQMQYRESAIYDRGSDIVVADTPVGRLGLSICYDLRFAELYTLLRQAGAELISIPSAFTVPTGTAHWEVLVRARAIETQCYILAAAQGGAHSKNRITWGHSCIVDPWGCVAAMHDSGEYVLVGKRQEAEQANIRQSMPVMTHRCLKVSQ